MDIASNFMLYHLRNMITAEIIRRLQDYFKHYSTPHRILTDNDSRFSAKQWQDFLAKFNIMHVLPTTYPQGNLIELYNREIRRILRTCCNEHTQWSQYLHEVVHFMNKTVSEYQQAAPQQVFLNLPCDDFMGKSLNTIDTADIENKLIREQALRQQFKGVDRTKGRDKIQVGSIVYPSLEFSVREYNCKII